MSDLINEIIKKIAALREFASYEVLMDLKKAINDFFQEAECIDVIYTTNTDSMPFGVIVTPKFNPDSINGILLHGNSINITKYFVEIDSKMFYKGLSDEEIAAVMLYNIHYMTADSTPIDQLRELIDSYFVSRDTQLHIRDSVKYQQLLEFGLVDTLIKMTNCLYLDDDILDDAYLGTLGFDNQLSSAKNKIFGNYYGTNSTASRHPYMVIIDWCLRLYGNVKQERIPAIHQLEESKSCTASVLYKRLIDNAIDALYRIDTDGILSESAVNLILEGKKGGFFSQIKYNGLRGIEDDLYEFIIRARNAETEDEVMYALKQINARLAILDDYIRYEELSDEDRKRWTDVYIKYKQIRDEIANKKVYNKKNYGIFFDYNQLDQMYDGDY